jgi:hypothetical protein
MNEAGADRRPDIEVRLRTFVRTNVKADLKHMLYKKEQGYPEKHLDTVFNPLWEEISGSLPKNDR